MNDEIRRLIEQVQLPLDQLKKELEELESDSSLALTDEQLKEKLSYLHAGYGMKVASIEPGTVIYRAIDIAKLKLRPEHRSQVSYPPQEIAAQIGTGRMNRAGEIVFYGALSGYYGCLEECSWAVGQLFAVSAWITKEPLWVNYFGYSKDVIEATTKRPRPAFTNDEDATERNALLQSWQSKIFTRTGKESESVYRLTIALKELGWQPSVRALPNGLNHVSGTMYPSVATRLQTENIVLRTSEVDTKLDLVEVLLLVLNSREERSISGGAKRLELAPKYYDFARPDEHENLIWGQQSQVVSAFLDMTKVQQRRLKPDVPYSHVGWRHFR